LATRWNVNYSKEILNSCQISIYILLILFKSFF
jgi:hypothetical protein